MLVKSITVANYKNLAETRLELGKITALVSTNNYGKSNLLEAISFGFDFISASSKIRNSMMRWVKGIPLITETAHLPFTFTIELEAPELEEYRFIRYGYSFDWLRDHDVGARIVDETIEARPTTSVKYTSYLKRQQSQFRISKDKSNYRKIALADDKLAIDSIAVMPAETVGIEPIVQRIIGLSYRMCNHLDLCSSFNPTPIEFDFGQKQALPFDDDDIPRALSVLKNDQPQLYARFEEMISELFPEFESIELQKYMLQSDFGKHINAVVVMNGTREEISKTDIPYHLRNEIYQLMIQCKYMNQPISMEYMSTGTKRVIWLIANALVAEKNGVNVLGIDEVETSIHPRLIKGMLESLSDVLCSASILVTSHSPYLIQYLKPQSIYIGVSGHNGVAAFRRVKDGKIRSLYNAAQRMNQSIGEYLFELMSGDTASIEVLNTYLEA